jgi:LmeA-like phospholipid-binding
MRIVLAAVLVPVVVIFLIGPYTFLPSLIEYAVATDVQNRLGIEKQPEVRLKSDPPLAMLKGEFSGGRIAMRNVDLGGVRAEKASIDLDPFDIDVWDTMKSGRVVDREPLSGALEIEVSEDEISRLAQKASGMPVASVKVQRDGVLIGSEASALGTQFPVSVEGDLAVEDGDLVFEPASLEAAGVPVPDELADRLLAGADFEYPLDRLPYQTTINMVETEEGRIVLDGRVPSIPLGVYPGG